MGLIISIEKLWITIGTHIFPATIHPMVVHFPIALLYITLLIEVWGYLFREPGDRFYDRASFWTLSLSILGIIGAGASGLISESFVKFTPHTTAILAAHQRDATLTGVFALLAWFSRWRAKFSRATGNRQMRNWSLYRTGRGRMNALSTFFVILATIMISITGTLGGSMVYKHGVGIKGVSRLPANKVP